MYDISTAAELRITDEIEHPESRTVLEGPDMVEHHDYLDEGFRRYHILS